MANQNDNTKNNQSIVYQDNQVFLYKPESASSRSTVYVRPGDLIQLNFDIKEARVEVVNGDLHIVFANGSTMTLLSLAAMGFSTAAPVIRDTDGNLMDVAEFLNKTYTVNYNNAYLILTNRDEYNLSNEQPDAIVSAADSTETLEGGNPISGAGTTDVFINGVITSDVIKGVVNSKTFKTGKGNLPETNFTTNNPFTETSSNYLPGTIDENSRPVLAYKVFYGVDFKDTGSKALEGNNGLGVSVYSRSFSVAQGLDDSDDKNLLLDRAKLDLSAETRGVLVLSTLASMEYLFDLNYTGGIFPSSLAVRVPKDSGVSIESPIVRPMLDSDGNSTGVYQFITVDQSGSSKFSVKFPYGMPARVLDLTYEVTYLDPLTSEVKFASYNQTLKINPVTSQTDLGDDGDFVLANGAPGIDVVAGSNSDIIFGGSADNKISSSGGDDYVFSGTANDIIDLGAGNDSYWASLGVDRIEGGTGIDTAYYNNYANKIKKDTKSGGEYEVGNLLDKTGETILDSFYNTYTASKGLVFNVGASNIASSLYLDALIDRYGSFEVGSYINPTTVLVIKEQSKSDDGRFNLFDLYSNTEVFYGVDKLTDIVKYDYNGNTKYGRFTFYAGDSFKGVSYDSVVVDKNHAVTIDMSKVTDSKNFINVNFNNLDLEKSKFSGYNVFEASDKDDVIYGGLGFNKFVDYDYTMYGSGADTDYVGKRFGEGYTIYGGLGNDTIDYSRDSRITKIEFNATTGKLIKYYNVTLTDSTGATKVVETAQTDILAINKSGLGYIENIVGTERADKFVGGLKTSSASSSLSYTYTNNFTTKDTLTYALARGNAVTLVLGKGGSRQVFKGTINDEVFVAKYGSNALNTSADLANLLEFNKNIKDTVVGNIAITLSMGSDFIVSEEEGIYTFGAGSDIDAFWSQAVRDYIAYTAISGGIELNYTGADGEVTVNKNGKGIDTFKFYDTKLEREEIYGVYGSEHNDTFNLGNGNSGERHKIFGADGNDTINFSTATKSVTIQLGSENYARIVDGAIYLFEGVENVIGSKQDDKVIISFKADASSLSNISIDLGEGNDEVDFSNASPVLLGSKGLEATFESGKMTAIIGASTLEFFNAESAKGTAYNDTFIVKQGAQEGGIYNGFVGNEDFIDYSDVSTNLTFDFSKGHTKGEVTREGSSLGKDQIKDIEKVQGGSGGNTFKSNGFVSYIFQGATSGAADQILDYSSLGVGVVFDIAGQVNYKVNYTSKLYLDAEASNDYSALIKDTYTNITQIKGSLSDDAFLLTEDSANTFDIDGGQGTYDILDLSKFASAIKTTLVNTNSLDVASGISSLSSADGFHNLAIISGGNTYNANIRDISGLKLTAKDDTVTLNGVADFYIDGGAGNDTVKYENTNTTVYDFTTNLAIAVDVTADNLGVSKYYTPKIVDGVPLVKVDKLINVENLELSGQDDLVKMKAWNNSINSINGGAGRNQLSFADFVATKPTVITANLGKDDTNSVQVTTNQNTGELNLFNFVALTGAAQKNVTVNFVLYDVRKVENSVIQGRLGDGTTIISFDAASYTTGVRLNLSATGLPSSYNSTLQYKAGTDSTASNLFIKDINKIVLTKEDDFVTGSKDSSTDFDGGLGNNTLSYDGVAFGSSGVNFSFDRKTVSDAGSTTQVLIGKAMKASGAVDTFTNFTTLEGSSQFSDSVTIDSLAALKQLLSDYPTLVLDLKGSTASSNDKVLLKFNESITFNISNSQLTVNSEKVNLGWIRSTNSAGDAEDLELLFGDKDDTLIYDGIAADGRYTVISGGDGNNTIDGSKSKTALFYKTRTGEIAESKAALDDGAKYKVINFNKIIGSTSGGNYFAASLGGIDPVATTYVGSGLSGDNKDTLSYADNNLSLVFKFNSATAGTVTTKGRGTAKGDFFENIKYIEGGQQGNVFEFNQDSLQYLDGLNLRGSAGTDVIYLNLTNNVNAVLSSTGLSVGGQSISLDQTNSIEVIMFNDSTTDTVTIEDGLEFGLQISGTEKTDVGTDVYNDKTRKDIIITKSLELLNENDVTLLKTFEDTTVSAPSTGLAAIVDSSNALETRDKVSVVFDSKSDEFIKSTSGNKVTDVLRGFKEIRHDATTGKMLVVASVRSFDYVGADQGAEGYSLYADYSKIRSSGVTYFTFDRAYNKVVVKKDPALVGAANITEAEVYNDTLTNVAYILGTQGADVFELYSSSTGQPTKNIIIYGNGGGDTISFDKARDLLNTTGTGNGTLGSEYTLSVAGAITVAGYTLLGNYIYGLTEDSDAFKTTDTSDTSVSQQVNALGGIDLLDYRNYGAHTWNITVNFIVNQVTKERYPSVGDPIFAAADNMYNFERAFTGAGDDVIIANEKQLFLKDTTYQLPSIHKLFDTGAGYNTLNISGVDESKYSVDLTYEWNAAEGINQTTIVTTRVADGVTNTTTSVGFGSILSGYANINYVFDANHLNEIAFGVAKPTSTATGKHLNFEAKAGVTNAKFNFGTRAGVGNEQTITVKLQSSGRDLVVAQGTTDFINLKGYNEFNVSGASVLNFEAEKISSMVFTGGTTNADRADFTKAKSLGLVKVKINNITGTTSSIDYEDSSGTITLNNIETIITENAVELLLVERVEFNAATDYTFNITAGADKTNIVSFESFTSAITGTDAVGYNLSNFTKYKLTNQADTFEIADTDEKVIDALASGTGRDTVRFLNTGGVAYTSGVIIIRENAIDRVNKTTSTGVVNTDSLENFEVFVLTGEADEFTLNNNTVTVTQPLYTEIDFAGGLDKANLGNFTGFTSANATYSTANGFDITFKDGSTTTEYTYILKNLEELTLYKDINLSLSGDDFKEIKLSASGNNSINYNTTKGMLGDDSFIFELQSNGTDVKLLHYNNAGELVKEMANISGFYNYKQLTGRIGFKSFTDFTKDYTLFDSFNNSGLLSLVDYGDVNFNLQFNLNATSAIISQAGVDSSGKHTVGARNIILSSKDSTITVNAAVPKSVGDAVNIGVKKPVGGGSFSSNVVVDFRNTVNTGVGKDTLVFLDGEFPASWRFGGFAGAPDTDTIVEVTTQSATTITSVNMNFYGATTFLANGNTSVNLNTTNTALTKEYIFTGTNNSLVLNGAVANDTVIDINLSTAKLLNYTSNVTNVVHNIKIDGFTDIEIAAVGELNFRLSEAGISDDSRTLLINANADTSTLVIDSALTSSRLSVIDGKVNLLGVTASNKEFNARGFNKQITLSSGRDNLAISNNILNTAAFVNTSGGGDTVSYSHTSGSLAAQFLGSGNLHLSTKVGGTKYGIAGQHVLINGVDSLVLGDSEEALGFDIGVAFSTGYLGASSVYNIIANYKDINSKKVEFSLLDGLVTAAQKNDDNIFSSNNASVLTLSNSSDNVLQTGGITVNLSGFNYYNLGNGRDAVNVNLVRDNTNNKVSNVYINQDAGNSLSYTSSLFLNASGGDFADRGVLGILTIVGASSTTLANYTNFVSAAYLGISGNTSYNIFNTGVINYSIVLGADKSIITNDYSPFGVHLSTNVALPNIGVAGGFIMQGINTVFSGAREIDLSGNVASRYSFTSDSREQSAFFLGDSIISTGYRLDSVNTVTVGANSVSMSPTYTQVADNTNTQDYNLNVTGYRDIFFGIVPDYNNGISVNYSGNTVLKITDINNASNNGVLYRFFGVNNDIGVVDIGTTAVEAINAYVSAKYRVDTVDFSSYADPSVQSIQTFFDVANNAFHSTSSIFFTATGEISDDTIETFNFERFKGASGKNNEFDISGIVYADRQTLIDTLANSSPLILEGGPGLNNSITIFGPDLATNSQLSLGRGTGGAGSFMAGFFLKDGAGNTTNVPVVLFENITELNYFATRMYIADNNILGGYFNINSGDMDNEFEINSFKDNFVLDGKGGLDTYVLANDISYTLHKAKDGKVSVDVELSDGTTQAKEYSAEYYLTLEDGNGNTAYVFNIDGNKITQNGVDTLVDDLKLSGSFVDDSLVTPSVRSLSIENAFFVSNQQSNEDVIENESNEIAMNDLIDLANNNTIDDANNLNINLNINEVVTEDDSLDYSLDTAFNNVDNTDNNNDNDNDNDVVSNDLLANITQEDLLSVESTEIVDEYKAPEEQESDSVTDVQKQLDKHNVV